MTGDEVLVTRHEYPSLVYPFMAQEHNGVKVKLVDQEDRRITPEAIEEGLRSILADELAPEWRVTKKGRSAAPGVTFNPDLVLCDMMMEKIDSGSKVTQEIKNSKPDLPVYLLSSIGEATASNVEIEKLGFKGVFQKPVSPEQLIHMVKKTLGI